MKFKWRPSLDKLLIVFDVLYELIKTTSAVGFCAGPSSHLSMFHCHSHTTHLADCRAQDAPIFWSSQELRPWRWTKEHDPPHWVLGLRTSLQGYFPRLFGDSHTHNKLYNVHFIRFTLLYFVLCSFFFSRFPVFWFVQWNMSPTVSTFHASRFSLSNHPNGMRSTICWIWK